MVTSKSLFAKVCPAQNVEAGDAEEKIWSCGFFFCVQFFLCNLSTIFRVNSLLESTQGFFPRLNWLRGRVNITSKQTGKALIPFPGKSVDYRQPKEAIYGCCGGSFDRLRSFLEERLRRCPFLDSAPKRRQCKHKGAVKNCESERLVENFW